MTSSVLVPSFRRPGTLVKCLDALATQRVPPGEVIVVWQADDTPTRDAAESRRDHVPYRLIVLHSPQAGVVPAENTALDAANGAIILLIDDDALAPPDWIERHLAHYHDATIGAVGGPAINHRPDGNPFPTRAVEPIGLLSWYGKFRGNMFDHVPEWRTRPPREVDHLVGYNMSLRRTAFDRFEAGLRPYWQLFEGDACFQAQARGFRVVFDFGIVVEHHPTNPAYTSSRDGDLQIKIYNGAYNHAFLMAKHSPPALRGGRLLYLLMIGHVNAPGLLASALSTRRFGRPGRELTILGQSWKAKLSGWKAGSLARHSTNLGNRSPQPED